MNKSIDKTQEALRVERALKLALEAMGWTDEWRPEGLKEQAITAIRAALASKSEALAAVPEAHKQPAYRAVKTFHEGKPVYVAEQPQGEQK